MWAPSRLETDGESAETKAPAPAPFAFDPAAPNDFSRRAVDQLRRIKVMVIGAGMSGILVGTLFPRGIENLDLVIYDKNPDMGGTWYESRYPGVACDIPAHAYQYTFESNQNWSSYWAGGGEIQGYLKHVASKYRADKYMKFNHKIEKAEWDEKRGKWVLDLTKTDTGEKITDEGDVLINASGPLNKWNFPDIPGLKTYKGKLLHSAAYDTSFKAEGKRVAIIGGGSSGIQMTPQIQRVATRVDHYMKGKTWIPPFGLGAQGLRGSPKTTDEDLKSWEDPQAYLDYRRGIEAPLHLASAVLYKDTPDALGFQQMCEDHMRTKLAKKPEIFEALRPSFAPACRRLTPGPGYLEALCEDNVHFIPTGIEGVNETGITTNDGVHREVDAIICATGYAGYKQHFPLIGLNGINLQDQWTEDVPESYLGISPQNMPNYFVFLGPNGGPGVGSSVPFLEGECRYIIKAVNKLQREWLKSMSPKTSAVKAFGRFADKFFEPTVFNSTCNAWWRHKGNGRLLAIWPGSALQGLYIWKEPRWEDWDYELCDELEGEQFAWFGNGYVTAQIEGSNMTPYLDQPNIPVETVAGQSDGTGITTVGAV